MKIQFTECPECNGTGRQTDIFNSYERAILDGMTEEQKLNNPYETNSDGKRILGGDCSLCEGQKTIGMLA